MAILFRCCHRDLISTAPHGTVLALSVAEASQRYATRFNIACAWKLRKESTWFGCQMELWLPQCYDIFTTLCVSCTWQTDFSWFVHGTTTTRYLGTSTQIPPGPRYLAGRYEIRNPRSEILVSPCEVPTMLRDIHIIHIQYPLVIQDSHGRNGPQKQMIFPASQKPPFIWGFSIAMLNKQMVYRYTCHQLSCSSSSSHRRVDEATSQPSINVSQVSVTLCGARCELLNITKTELRCVLARWKMWKDRIVYDKCRQKKNGKIVVQCCPTVPMLHMLPVDSSMFLNGCSWMSDDW